MDAIAIKEAAEAIKTLAAQAAAVTALAPFHDEINALTDQIAFQADCILRWYLSDTTAIRGDRPAAGFGSIAAG